ncbi:hypothetical protein [Sinomicrobium weinanense]|uniref:Uncharacterized protein n=1 Tax=Sinomicrobium weinanense TaxID=2842200 RepID=A0A926JUJ1_9FLAO|nr:hypothetical protein [Sinomicrobium weinanense]MBC9797805.1 hypothetical protein [Sinomicrobium weinanense]MBU3125954.1 hypothetical protein [Sinomicrobium weinanense]
MDQLAISVNRPSAKNETNSVYLQTNKDIYVYDEDFWFKAWVLDSKSHLFSPLDKTLYVTLSKASNDSVVFREKYQIKNGTTNGHIYIKDTWPEGEYWLSSYSGHSVYNNDMPFYDRRKINIVPNIADINIKTSHKNNNQVNKHIQFNVFPEGGHLISELNNTVAFKAVSSDGKPVKIKGALYENGKVILPIQSFHDGMGKFDFVPNGSKRYTIQLDKQTDTIYTLPVPKKQGTLLHLESQTKEKLVFKVVQTPIYPEQKVYLRIQTRGIVQFIARGMLKDSLRIKIPLQKIPQGVAEVTLFDSDLKPLAERLVYINMGKKLNLSITGLEEFYGTRKKVKLKIKTSDSKNNPVRAQLSVSVSDHIYQYSKRKNILTHYFLSTQLKGQIYNPEYYFDTSHKNSNKALDLLMLTQGWRKYTWNEESLQKRATTKNIIPPVETGTLQAIKIKKNNSPQHTMMLFNPTNNTRQMLVLDDDGTFKLDESSFKLGRRLYLKHFPKDDDKYAVYLINTFDKIKTALTGKNKPYPVFDNKDKPQPFDSLMIAKREQRIISLEEVRVSAKKKSVFRDKYLGQLDSLAKLDINTDYVCISNILNCPVHENDSRNRRPVEGEAYESYIGFQWNTDRSGYTIKGKRAIKYHYPEFTEEEILKKHNLTKVQGYYGKKVFYSPIYDKKTLEDPFPDYRNTLLWAPSIRTDENGEATIHFYTSDINTQFIGIIEGMGSEGQLGHQNFKFFVRKN